MPHKRYCDGKVPDGLTASSGLTAVDSSNYEGPAQLFGSRSRHKVVLLPLFVRISTREYDGPGQGPCSGPYLLVNSTVWPRWCWTFSLITPPLCWYSPNKLWSTYSLVVWTTIKVSMTRQNPLICNPYLHHAIQKKLSLRMFIRLGWA